MGGYFEIMAVDGEVFLLILVGNPTDKVVGYHVKDFPFSFKNW